MKETLKEMVRRIINEETSPNSLTMIYTKTVPDFINIGFINGNPSKTIVDWYKIYPYNDIKNDPLMGKTASSSFKNKISYIISEKRIRIPNKYYITSQMPIYWVYCDDMESVHVTKFRI